MYQLVDTHSHLEEIEDVERAVSEARSAGILAIVAVGSDYESNQRVLSLARAFKELVYPALGFHPWRLKDADIERNLEFVEAHVPEAIAIGEVGLDYDKRVRQRAEKGWQKDVFQRMLRIGKNHGKPVLVHSRYAWRDALDIINQVGLDRVVFHWYTGTSSVLRDIVSQGYFISATPAVEYHEEHRRAVKEIPLDRLLLETDSPVVYRRGTEFEYESRPVHLLRSLSGVSALKGRDESQIAEITTANALKFFGL